MIVRAVLKNYRMSPRKVRLVADLVRGKNVDEAIVILQFTNKKASLAISKLIKSAIANATHNFNMDRNKLLIKEIRVDEAVTYKRWMPRAMGRATPIRKRGSHITVTLSDDYEGKVDKKEKAVKEAKKKVEKKAVKKATAKKTSAKAEKKDNKKEDNK